MADRTQSPYSKREVRKAKTIAALAGWAAATAVSLYGASASQLLLLLPFAAIIGLPIAFFAVWVLGGGIIRWTMRQPVSWLRAASTGASLAAVGALLSIIIGRVNGYQISQDAQRDQQLGGGDYVRSIDGILTPYGWLVVAQNAVIFILLGALIGLFVRYVIGPGQQTDQTPTLPK